ncbi:MAG: lcfB10 [Mycobacterium sp.]|nr:lcfB10 [Mycobacterium sp.]
MNTAVRGSPDLSLADIVRDNAVRYRDVPAYIGDGRVLTHGQLYERASRLTAVLEGLGLRRQERIGLYGRNSLAFGEVLAAGQLSGLIVATVNFRLAGEEIARILADAAPRIVFVDADLLPVLESALPSLPSVETVVCLDADHDSPAAVAYEPLLARATSEPRHLYATPDDVACLIYTSGTTGRPKGCMLGQREMRQVAFTMNSEMRSGCDDAVLLVMPMFHIGALAIGLGLHARGGTAVLHPQFDPAAALETIADGGISVLHLAPTMLGSLLQAAEGQHGALTGIKTVVYSAAPITSAVLRSALTAMPAAGFLNLYGQTEVITSGLPRELHKLTDSPRDHQRLTSVGHPFPGTKVRIVNEDGGEADPGTAGEITVRTTAVFRGYWNDSAATATTIRDGWCHTGDIGVMDKEGLLYLVDRKKDVIISGGENVYSVEVEDAICSHPQVLECAVIGVPDEQWGEAVCAIVVARPDSELGLEQLREHLETRIARYKAPKRLILVEAIPKLPTGKMDKKLLRTTYACA